MMLCLITAISWIVMCSVYGAVGAYKSKMSRDNGIVFTLATTFFIGFLPAVIFLIITSVVALLFRWWFL